VGQENHEAEISVRTAKKQQLHRLRADVMPERVEMQALASIANSGFLQERG
jgi:hypothetical protein